jgi:hypothetical protein
VSRKAESEMRDPRGGAPAKYRQAIPRSGTPCVGYGVVVDKVNVSVLA